MVDGLEFAQERLEVGATEDIRAAIQPVAAAIISIESEPVILMVQVVVALVTWALQ